MVSLQVPLQNNAEDWKLGNFSCYDAACVARLQEKLKLDFRGIAEGTPRDCLVGRLSDGFEAMLVAETLKADPDALGRLMADHTQVTQCGSPETPSRYSDVDVLRLYHFSAFAWYINCCTCWARPRQHDAVQEQQIGMLM